MYITYCCKRRNASDPTNTAIPFTKHHLIRFVDYINYILIHKYTKLITKEDKIRKKTYLITSYEIKNHLLFITVRMILVSTSIMALTGIRLGETVHPINKKKNNYGIRKRDITFMHRVKRGISSVIIKDNRLKSHDTLHAVYINIQNNKMRNKVY